MTVEDHLKEKTPPEVREKVDKLLEQGKLIEAGWTSLSAACFKKGTPKGVLRDMHFCFFAGAHHIFSALWASFDDEEGATEADVKRVEQVHKEMLKFQQELKQMLKLH